MKLLIIATRCALTVVALVAADIRYQARSDTEQTTVERREQSVGPDLRTVPLTGRDTGIGIGIEIAPNVHMDLGTGNLN